jgi:hypothetical protein
MQQLTDLVIKQKFKRQAGPRHTFFERSWPFVLQDTLNSAKSLELGVEEFLETGR